MNRIAFLAALLIFTIMAIAAPVQKRRTTYSGRGTWFTPSDPKQGGDMGACGGHLADDAMIIALNLNQYGNQNKKSKYCGKYVTITGPHGTAKAKVADCCASCPSKGQIDMTQALFNKVVGKSSIGVGTVHWYFD
ncbi:hypothetical protein K450DRAFT_281524 [Umbelopsis ramanniana AG]|uniref:RlpA-like double-psi beta-barrel-protein domain-containing protein-containing protein n=1 Tax=Umbelopsis ramanniana AG TaxID=1314678 RepID=A0AAD5E725_UMBRA|nr:uncharacterized protein K450DRAFT_281524 [Umbelopsis ramanniana AG]KAI8578653.1 hypothetical protein K450DRAFT_281524 [Umbelopsis ramanniana AG]